MSDRQLSLKDWLKIASLGPSAIRAAEAAFEFEQAINKIQNADPGNVDFGQIKDGILSMTEEQKQ